MNRIAVNICAAVALSVLVISAAWSAGGSAPWVGESLAGAPCTGPSAGNFGPFDYLVHKDKLPVVERRHFTSSVEQLRRGETTRDPMGDISYTLTKFPNHHRALYSAVRYSLGEAPGGARRKYPAECFLQRAIYFSPGDPVPHMLFGLYLHRLGKLKDSIKEYRIAEELAPNDANLLYNIGLVHFDSGNFNKSYLYATKAYDMGIGLPGLKRKLQKSGHWK